MSHSSKTRGVCCTKIEHLSVSLGERKILSDINLHFHCGELTAIIGPNGAGKTTLLRAILGEIPHKGVFHFVDAEHQSPDSPVIGYVPQKFSFDASSPISVLDLFASIVARKPLFFGCGNAVKKQAIEALEIVGARHLLDCTLGKLSGGELQRVLLALSIVPLPNLLLMDEPVSNVDASGIEMFYRNVSDLREKYDLAIILVSHDLAAAAQVANRMIFLDQKIICEGTPAEILDDEQVRRVFGLNLSKAIAYGDHLNICPLEPEKKK
jgi:zinc transport system ATP-binding protein